MTGPGTRPGGPALEPERRQLLLGAKLRGLVAHRWGPDADGNRRDGRFLGGATLVDDDGGFAAVLAEDHPYRSLGGALAWHGRTTAELGRALDLHLILADPDAAGIVARQAACFAPRPTVWLAVGTELVAVEPAPPHVPAPAPDGVESLAALIDATGADRRVDHGRVVGEWLGLELACIVVDPEFGARLEVGVGRHDREAFGMIHGDVPAPEALRTVLEAVQEHRRSDRPSGPLTRIARESWLGAELVADPGRVDAAELRVRESTVARESVMVPAPTILVGSHRDGTPLVVACTAGIDLNLVPAAADARVAYAPDASLVLAVAAADRSPVTERLAAALVAPAEVRTVPVPWQRPIPPT